MNKKIIIAIILVVLVIVVYFAFFRKPNTRIIQTTTTTIKEGTSSESVDCADNGACLSAHILSCEAAEFKMDFTTPGSKYTITVYGKEDGKCHYGLKVLNADGSLMAGIDCKMPLTSMSDDTFKHLFGQDTGTVKDAQNQLQATYCTALQ